MGRRQAFVLGAFALATVVALAIPGVATASSSPSGSATPASNLHDGQVIAVAGVGFDPDAQVGVVECLTGAVSTGQCDLAGIHFTTTDGSGSLAFEFTVTRVINVGGSLTDCATPDACILGMEETANQTESATVALSFENVPIVPPTVTVTPSTGLLDQQTVEVAGTGYTPGATVALIECPAGSAAVSACDFSTGLFVTADGSGAIDTPYRAVRAITVNGASLDCATPMACAVSVGNVDDFDQRSLVPISFENLPIPIPNPVGVSTAPPPVTPSGAPPVATLALTGISLWPLVRFGGTLVIAGVIVMQGVPRLGRTRRARRARTRLPDGRPTGQPSLTTGHPLPE
jgi:hypothetical protein